MKATLVLESGGELQVIQSDGVEVVISQRDKTKTQSAQLDNLLDDSIRGALAGALAVSAPNRAEGAMLGAAAHGLHRSPHVPIAWNQIPAGRDEVAGFNATS